MSSSVVRVAFVGLGHMGAPMAARLAGGDNLSVSGFDVLPELVAAVSSFARPCTSLAEAVVGVDVVCTMVPADRHLISVADELVSVAQPGQIFVDFSTVSPTALAAVADRLSPRGIHVVGATCMKSVAAAQAGQLSLYVGGDPGDVATLEPVFGRVATEWRNVGQAATAKTMKLVNNLLTSTTGLCLLDGLVLAAVLGCAPMDSVSALRSAGAGSWVLEQQVVRHALADDLGPGIFSAAYMSKDVGMAVELARRHGTSAFFGGLALAAYRGLASMGYAESYHPAVVRWLERCAGTGPITGMNGVTSPDKLAPLWPALRRVQQFVVDEALDIAAAAGVPRETAADLLQAGSARSDCLATFLSEGFERSQALTNLEHGLAIAAEAGVPALSLEIATNLAARGNSTRDGRGSTTPSSKGLA